jgi:phosphate-selective porin OprO/OprP
MRILFKITVVFVVITFLIYPEVMAAEQKKKPSVNERILEILIEKSIITKEQYEKLRQLAQEEEIEKKPKAVAGFNKGFYLESTDKQHKIKFDGRFHGDFKSYLGNHPDHSSFFVRRARLATSGTLYKYYDFRVEAEFGKGGARLNDGFMNIHYWPRAQLKLGQFKVPFSMEELTSDNWIDFIERSLVNRLVPSRDIGVMLHGGLQDQLFYYQLGIFNGYKLNQVNDPDNGKDLAFRLVVAPFIRTGHKAIENLRFGGAMTYGNNNLSENQFWNAGQLRTAAETTYLSFADGVVHDGDRTRGGLELYWDWGSTALKGEYIVTQLDGLRLNNQNNDFDAKGGYLSISHYLTGEKFGFKNGKPGRSVPLKKFEPGKPGWGAWQIGARFEFLEADQGLLDLGYVDNTLYTDKTYGYTLGVNWYPNEMVRFMLNYYHMEFDDAITVSGKQIDDEDVILTRFQMGF